MGLRQLMPSDIVAIYGESLRAGAHGRRQLLTWAQRYVSFTRGEMDRHSALAWCDELRAKGYADATIAWAWQMLRRLYIANGTAWPFTNGEGPVIRESDVFAPALHPDVIRREIEAARSGILLPLEAAVVALATIYGVRRVEIADLQPQDIQPKEGLILIRTAKKGRERWHKLPQEIVPYLECWTPGLTEHQIANLYLLAEWRTGVEHIKGVGIHGIRRSLDTLLTDHLPELVVQQFLRWRASSMVQRYRAVRFVGGDAHQGQVALRTQDRRTDEMVFEVHPFLGDWSG